LRGYLNDVEYGVDFSWKGDCHKVSMESAVSCEINIPDAPETSWFEMIETGSNQYSAFGFVQSVTPWAR